MRLKDLKNITLSKPLIASLLICVAALVMMTVALCINKSASEAVEFSPPPYDANAVIGVPAEVPEDLGYSKLEIEKGYVFYLCGNIFLTGNKADVYFTSPADNSVFLRLRIVDENEQILGETGLIRPGEYLQNIVFDSIPQTSCPAKCKIIAYQPETYYSMGTVTLNITLNLS